VNVAKSCGSVERKSFLASSKIICIVLAVSACATVQPASEADKNAAVQTMIACQRQAARQLDDHTSPAGDIAIAVDQACNAQREQAIAVFTIGMNADAARMLASRVRATGPSRAVEVVLLERAEK